MISIFLLVACLQNKSDDIKPEVISPGQVIYKQWSGDRVYNTWVRIDPPEGSGFKDCYYKDWGNGSWGVCK